MSATHGGHGTSANEQARPTAVKKRVPMGVLRVEIKKKVEID
jgi:hypothetical protein